MSLALLQGSWGLCPSPACPLTAREPPLCPLVHLVVHLPVTRSHPPLPLWSHLPPPHPLSSAPGGWSKLLELPQRPSGVSCDSQTAYAWLRSLPSSFNSCHLCHSLQPPGAAFPFPITSGVQASACGGLCLNHSLPLSPCDPSSGDCRGQIVQAPHH